MRDKGYDFIRFLAMTLIVVYHLYTRAMQFSYNVPQILKSIINSTSLNFGGIGVILFFMLSGAVLISRYKENYSYKSFYLKRFIRIEVPQFIGFWIIFWIVSLFFDKSILYNNPIGTLASSFGLNFYFDIPWKYFNIHTLWLIGEWFTTVIIILYLLFPLLRSLFLKHHILGTLLVSLIFLLNLKFEILTHHSGWHSVTNGLMCFWLGMLFEKYKNYLCNKCFIFSFLISLFLLIISNPDNFFGYLYLPCFIFSVLLFIVLYQIKLSTNITRYVCKYNYELYLVHHRVYILLFPLLLKPDNNYIQFFIVCTILLLVTCLSAQLLKYLSNKIISYLTLKIK